MIFDIRCLKPMAHATKLSMADDFRYARNRQLRLPGNATSETNSRAFFHGYRDRILGIRAGWYFARPPVRGDSEEDVAIEMSHPSPSEKSIRGS
jgi:hypothetical protein